MEEEGCDPMRARPPRLLPLGHREGQRQDHPDLHLAREVGAPGAGPLRPDKEATMAKYRDNPDAIRALLRDTEVHKDLFIDQELFDLEMERLYANTWVYVGHDSQVPNPGDYKRSYVGPTPVVVSRAEDGSVNVFENRCAHRGADGRTT
ncbi:hypothetical protein G6F35_016619 [Rhizopus arrhizus]|nr:hypothetical protein G6F35_016619 [Rhizopus arrhizus]